MATTALQTPGPGAEMYSLIPHIHELNQIGGV